MVEVGSVSDVASVGLSEVASISDVISESDVSSVAGTDVAGGGFVVPVTGGGLGVGLDTGGGDVGTLEFDVVPVVSVDSASVLWHVAVS